MIASSLVLAEIRRAVLVALADSDAYALEIHDRLRWSSPGLEPDHLGHLYEVLYALRDEGLVASRFPSPRSFDTFRRALWSLTPAGRRAVAELEELVAP